MTGIFTGSFDPFTTGHLDIVKKALQICNRLVIGIGQNEKKIPEWNLETRLKAISELFRDNKKVEVKTFSGLAVEFAKKENADFFVRGIRNNIDFEYEKNLARINKEIGGIDTVFLLSDPETEFVSSSMVRELIHNGFDVSKFIAGNFPISKK